MVIISKLPAAVFLDQYCRYKSVVIQVPRDAELEPVRSAGDRVRDRGSDLHLCHINPKSLDLNRVTTGP